MPVVVCPNCTSNVYVPRGVDPAAPLPCPKCAEGFAAPPLEVTLPSAPPKTGRTDYLDACDFTPEPEKKPKRRPLPIDGAITVAVVLMGVAFASLYGIVTVFVAAGARGVPLRSPKAAAPAAAANVPPPAPAVVAVPPAAPAALPPRAVLDNPAAPVALDDAAWAKFVGVWEFGQALPGDAADVPVKFLIRRDRTVGVEFAAFVKGEQQKGRTVNGTVTAAVADGDGFNVTLRTAGADLRFRFAVTVQPPVLRAKAAGPEYIYLPERDDD